jgi:hypothetical protein
MRRHLTAVCALAGLLAAGGCASAQPDAGSSSSPINVTSEVGAPPSPLPTGSASPVPTSSAVVNPPGPSPLPGEGVTVLRGEITAGVEPSCKLLTDDKVEYLLLADSNTPIPVGVGAIVTGHLAHGIMTHCQQGIPFVVTSIRQFAAPQQTMTVPKTTE